MRPIQFLGCGEPRAVDERKASLESSPNFSGAQATALGPVKDRSELLES